MLSVIRNLSLYKKHWGAGIKFSGSFLTKYLRPSKSKADDENADEEKVDEEKADEEKADEEKADEEKADEEKTDEEDPVPAAESSAAPAAP